MLYCRKENKKENYKLYKQEAILINTKNEWKNKKKKKNIKKKKCKPLRAMDIHKIRKDSIIKTLKNQ